jgi:hypothetical protein
MSFGKVAIDQTVAAVIKAMAEADAKPILDRKWNGRSTFSIHEAAEILGISLWAAYRAARPDPDGNLPPTLPTTKIGKRLVVPRHALERMLEA